MADGSSEHVLTELARAVAEGLGRDRLVHLVLENKCQRDAAPHPGGAGQAPTLSRPVERRSPSRPPRHAHGRAGRLLRGLPPAVASSRPQPHEGFAYQGQWSAYRGRTRGEPSAGLPPTSFVGFLQNHDQVGNRAFGERLTALAPPEAVRAATAVLLLAPSIPLLFMGQEWAAPEPFLFFADLGKDLAPLVSEGRRREFERFPEFAQAESREQIPIPRRRPRARDRCSAGTRSARLPTRSGSLSIAISSRCVPRTSRPFCAASPCPRPGWSPSETRASRSPGPFPTGACFDSSPTWAPRPWGTRARPRDGAGRSIPWHLAGGLEGAGPLDGPLVSF